MGRRKYSRPIAAVACWRISSSCCMARIISPWTDELGVAVSMTVGPHPSLELAGELLLKVMSVRSPRFTSVAFSVFLPNRRWLGVADLLFDSRKKLRHGYP